MSVLRHAARALCATPIVTAVAVVSLALGIGANTALFTLVNVLLLKPLPVERPDRLAVVGDVKYPRNSWTNPIWEAVRDRRSAFDGALAWGETRFNLVRGGQTRLVNGIFASGGFFDVLGVKPILGRTFSGADDARDGGRSGPVAVIGYGFWQRHFGASRDVVGKPLVLDGVAFTVVGVAPRQFTGLEAGTAFDVVVPLGCEAAIRGAESSLDRRSNYWLDIVVRLKPGQNLETATGALRAIQPQIREATLPPDWPARYLGDYLKRPFVLTGAGPSALSDRYQRPLLTLMVVVGLVLLIACANIANLLLARAAARRHELAVRLALGASRWRLTGQMLAESLLLAGSGAAAGLGIARLGSRLLVRMISSDTDVVSLDLSLDWRVMLFTTSVAMATAVLFGLAPALRAGQVEPQVALADRGRAICGSTGSAVGRGLITIQVALSLVLVVAGSAFVRTFTGLATLDPGFDRDRLLTVAVNGTRIDRGERAIVFDQLRHAVAAVPGVSSVATSVVTPVSGSTWQYSVEVVGMPPRPERDRTAHVNLLSPGWFDTYRMRLLQGRDLSEQDGPASSGVAVVNQEFVRQFLGGASDPVGRVVRQPDVPPGKPRRSWEIVGVVSDAVYRSLRQAVPPTMYVPLVQADPAPAVVRLTIRSAGSHPAALVRGVTEAIGRVAPDLPLTFRTLSDQVKASLLQERLIASIAGFFGGLGLLLAALGLYGLTSYFVARRRGEIGVRMALGARPALVVRLVVAQLALPVAVGVALGVASSWWASVFVGSLLYGPTGRDATTLAGSVALLAVVAVAAAWLPAARAARVNPVEILREA